MSCIQIATFNGEVPRVTPRLLGNEQAQVAVNCDLKRGALEPLKGPLRIASMPTGTRTIFKHDVNGWMTWSNRVNVVKSAVLDIDGESQLGHIFITGDKPYPTQYFADGTVRRLGIPRPGSAPKVTLKTGAIAITVRAFAWGAETLSRVPPRYGYEDLLSEIIPDSATADPLVSDPSIDSETGELNISRTSTYCYTLVQTLAGGQWQQESAPSPASAVIDVPDGDGVTVSGFVLPNLADLTVTAIRIYRAVVSSEGVAEFQFLAEIPPTQKSYLDTTHDADMSGDVLATTTWDCIPDEAMGLIKTDNGIYAAFRGNEVLLSEPFVPYAFPEEYRNTVEDTIVALGHTDNTIIVLTTGRPYLVTGSEPESMQYTHLPIEQSCVSAKSVATIPGGVIYASPDGLMLFTSKEQSLATAKTWTREQWQNMNPDRLMGTVHDERYVGFFEGTNTGFLYAIGGTDVVEVRLPSGWKVYDVYHHSQDDCVYLAIEGAPTGIYQFEAGEPMEYTWQSKLFFSSRITSMGAVRVEADFDGGVVVDVFGPDQNVSRQTLTLTNSKTTRLKTLKAEKLWSIQVRGTSPVFELRMANSVEGLEYGE